MADAVDERTVLAESSPPEFSFDFSAHARTTTFQFTAHARHPTFHLSGLTRRHRVTDCEVERLHVALPVLLRSTLRVKLERQHLRVTDQALAFRFSFPPPTTIGAVQFVVRMLRRYAFPTESELHTLYGRWPTSRKRPDLPDLRHFSQLFVPVPSGQWTLTTWARLGVPFTPLLHTYGWTREGYVQEAARFWLERQQTPNEE